MALAYAEDELLCTMYNAYISACMYIHILLIIWC